MLTLLIDTIQSSCVNDYSQEQVTAWVFSARKDEHWDSFLNDQFSVLAEIDNRVVGFGSLENGNYIYFLYVHKDFQGLGVAGKIYEQLQNKSQEQGQLQITANVSKTALPFFESRGFELVKENKNIINDVVIINFNMIKSLIKK